MSRRTLLVAIAVLAVAAGGLGLRAVLQDDPVDDASSCGDPAIDAPELPASVPSGPAIAFESLGFDAEFVTGMVVHPDGRELFLLRDGRLVQRVDGDDEEIFDVEVPVDSERGALGLTLSPDGSALYLTYTPDESSNVLVELQVTPEGVDAASERELLRIPNERGQHMMNNLAFGPDGFLYVGVGDTGEPRSDPDHPAQDPTDLRGKILRIDPRPSGDAPYTVPDDNPFAAPDGAPEVFLLGVRNPWRFSVDPDTGDLWITDVGENCAEEITRLAPGDAAGANLGWSSYEAVYGAEGLPDLPDAEPPTLWFRRFPGGDAVRCAGIGGFVYHGDALAGIEGSYLFGDLCERTLFAVDVSGPEPVVRSLGLREAGGQLLAIVPDGEGEPVVLTTEGVLRVVPG